MTELSKIAKRIRQARKEARLSQLDLARAIGVSDKSVSAYEKDRAVPPISKLKKIAEKTGFPVNYFTEEDGKKAEVEGRINQMEKELQQIKKLLRKNTS